MNKVKTENQVPANSVLELVDVLKDGIVLYRIAAGFSTSESMGETLGRLADVRELSLFRLQPYLQEWNSLANTTVDLKTQLYSRYFGRIQEIQEDSDLLILKQLEGETLSAMEAAIQASRHPMIIATLNELLPLLEESFNSLFSLEAIAA